jgi:tRNA (adenine57-N1/adenine58-N1)-methyltransferase
MSKDHVREGEWILLYSSERAQYLTRYQPGKKFSTHLGELELAEGLKFGENLKTHTGKDFFVLKPTTSLLSMRVKRTTTIIYPKDAGLILLETGIGAGSRVIEVGTGSGAMTIILAKAVGMEGKVYSFERRPEFLENARENVEKYGLSDRVVFHLKDPAESGYGVNGVDAAIIDVPEPWSLVEPTWEALRGGGSWASLSPTIDQVVRTFEALSERFVKIRCVEILEREILVRPGKTRPRERMVSHTGYLLFAQKVQRTP